MNIKLWEATETEKKQSKLSKFIDYINEQYDRSLCSFSDIHTWSIENPAKFWAELTHFFDLNFSHPPVSIVDDVKKMPGTQWFNGATLNYAEHCLRSPSPTMMIYEINESGCQQKINGYTLYSMVSTWVQFFNDNNIKKGDRVAAILPNNLTAIVAMLAATSIGAVWSSCSPDFGEKGICDRLEQINPTCIISISTYIYKGKSINIADRLKKIQANLNNTKLWVNTSNDHLDDWISIDKINQYKPSIINFVPCQFQDPLFILFSSGTTGKPKCIVHGVGGTLLQHLKEHQLHCDLKPSDTLFYYTTCGWMMWNWMVSALASHTSIVLYDGAAITKHFSIWELIRDYNISVFGCSASFIGSSQKRQLKLSTHLSNTNIRLILSTGSPLLPTHYDYLYSSFPKPIQVGSISGGSDIISCFALCNPLTPVYKGLLQGKGLGMDIHAYDDNHQSIISKKGELICKLSAPCMPIYFLNDPNFERYKSAYFNDGKTSEWVHGDYIIIHENGGLEILGRSDSTLNPGGIRMGSAEFYDILEEFDAIEDCIISAIAIDNDEKIVLFIKLSSGYSLNPELKKEIRYTLKEKASPRHMPQIIAQVSQIPYTKNGKKCEVNVKKIINGNTIDIQKSTLLNENSFNDYFAFFNDQTIVEKKI